jgi:hypothetical protein
MIANMEIIVESKSTGIFNRHKVRRERFTDCGGDYEAAMEHICLMIANERDINIRVVTPTRLETDALLEHVGTCFL